MTITATFDIHDEMLIRYALGLAVQKSRRDRLHADERHDVVASYEAQKIEKTFQGIERQLHQLEVEELRKIKKKG